MVYLAGPIFRNLNYDSMESKEFGDLTWQVMTQRTFFPNCLVVGNRLWYSQKILRSWQDCDVQDERNVDGEFPWICSYYLEFPHRIIKKDYSHDDIRDQIGQKYRAWYKYGSAEVDGVSINWNADLYPILRTVADPMYYYKDGTTECTDRVGHDMSIEFRYYLSSLGWAIKDVSFFQRKGFLRKITFEDCLYQLLKQV